MQWASTRFVCRTSTCKATNCSSAARRRRQEAKNRVWDQIKLVDPGYSDLTADISVNQSAAPQQQSQQQQAPKTMGAGVGSTGHRTYTVKSGDSLSKISREFYGNANEYMKIFEANRDKLSDPDKIQPGQELVIP